MGSDGVVENMSALVKNIFLENWQRKLISLVLAIIIWFVTHNSMTVTKTISQIPVRVIHLPAGQTIDGMMGSGLLNTKISLDLQGEQDVLNELSSKNLEVIIDATGQPAEWIANITKSNLHCTTPSIQLEKAIAKVTPQEIIIKKSPLISEKIPVLITEPIGEAPKGYQFLDVWPYHLYVTVSGPEKTVKKLKNRGLTLSFNLNEIARSDLDELQGNDEVSFLVPSGWKKIAIPQLSDQPIEIDDPQAKFLRIDFSRQDFLPIGTFLPITVYFPDKHSLTLNPDTYAIALSQCIAKKNGIKGLSIPLYTEGISKPFLDAVKDMMQITVIASPKSERESLLWNVQFIHPEELEKRYVAKVLSQLGDDSIDILPHMREEYLRSRFRRYMNRFRLYTANHAKLNLKIELQAGAISVVPGQDAFTAMSQ
jgi:hypothetical protein